MYGSRKRLVPLLTCVISFALLGGTVKALSTYSDHRLNRTRGDNPVSEFRTLMLQAISTLSVSRQCTILTAIVRDSGGILPRMTNTAPLQQLPCLPIATPSESSVNTSSLRRATDFYITRLFNTFPLAFQCKIISDVTFASRAKDTKRTGGLEETLSKLRVDFQLSNVTRRCANTNTNAREIAKNPYVRVVVRLRKTMPLKVWLARFKKILPNLYLSYISKTGRISEFVTAWRKNDKGAMIPVIPPDQFLVRIQDDPVVDDLTAVVTFSLYSRTPSGDYKLISGDEVVAAFGLLDQSIMNSYLQAEVIFWRSLGDRHRSYVERMRTKKGKLTIIEKSRLKDAFPKYLFKFFKSMSSDGRCYVLRQIGAYLNLHLSDVEKGYHCLGFLPKRYYCSRASQYGRKSQRPRPRQTSIWDRLDQAIRAILNATPTAGSTPGTLALNSRVIRETRPFNAMEIVMFVLLAFLCVLIMVFLANCVVFTLKTKQLNSKCRSPQFQAPQTVLRDVDGELNPPGKLSLTENPGFRVKPDREPSVFSDIQSEYTSARSCNWRLLSMSSEGGVTVCDVISLADDVPAKVSTV